MRLLWSARLDLPHDALPQVRVILGGWLRAPKREPSFAGELKPGDLEFPTGGRLQVDQSPETGEPQVWALRYERPVAEQGLVWITEVALERDESILRGIARLSQRSLSTARPRFERVVLRPPGFVFSLRNRGLLRPNRFTAHIVTRESVGSFVDDVVDPHRTVPIVAVSVDPYSEETLVNSSSLQDELVGIAQVVELDKAASILLPSEFAKRGASPAYARVWGVYGGAVKVYRVRAQVGETPFDHPIWLPVDVGEQGFAATLKDWCWSLAALEPPYLDTDVAAIRGARRLAIEPPAGSTLSVDDLTELYQSCLNEEQARTAEQRQRAEGEKARADELAERVQQLESKVQSLQFQLSRKLQATPATAEQPAPTDFADVTAALNRARTDFAATLIIPADVEVETSEAPEFWYGALHALHRLCELERRGEATNKRAQLRDLLKKHVGLSKDTYKIADTGVRVVNPDDGALVELRERVHLREGKPHETESIYWHTVGNTQSSYRYLVARLGRHV